MTDETLGLTLVKPPDTPIINALLYGPPKTGKSAGAGTAPGTILYLNFDLPNATRFVHRRSGEGKILEPRIPPFEEGKRPVWTLMVQASKIAQAGGVGSVVVDTVGELHRRLLEEFSHQAVRPSLNLRGDTAVQVERFLRFLCEAPVNAVFVCHELAVDSEDETLEKMPFTGSKTGSLTGLGPKLLSMVDIIGYTGVIQQEDGSRRYAAQLIYDKGRAGGDRFDALGDVADLDLEAWAKTIVIHESANVGTSKEEAKSK